MIFSLFDEISTSPLSSSASSFSFQSPKSWSWLLVTFPSLPGKVLVDKPRYSTRAETRIWPATLQTQGQQASRLIEMQRRTAGFGWGRLLLRALPGGKGPRVELVPETNVVCSARWPLPEKSIVRRYTFSLSLSLSLLRVDYFCVTFLS